MSWYDIFIPPEVSSLPKLKDGDYWGAAESQLGLGGAALKKGADQMDAPDMGFDDKRAGYQEAQRRLDTLGKEMRDFQMEGLRKAQNFYAPAQEMNTAIYGTPDKLKK
jgi:hypothetical protein